MKLQNTAVVGITRDNVGALISALGDDCPEWLDFASDDIIGIIKSTEDEEWWKYFSRVFTRSNRELIHKLRRNYPTVIRLTVAQAIKELSNGT